MALFSANNMNATTPARQNLSTAFKTQTELTAATATLRRAFIYDWQVGQDGTPNATDCQVLWDMSRTTSIGTGTAGVITLQDLADGATGTVSTINHTAEPTTTANSSLWAEPINQRASWRVSFMPGGPGEMVIPATNLNGITIRAQSTNYASTANCAVLFRE